MARTRPAVRELIAHATENTVSQLEQVDAEFAVAFTKYLKEYGCRGLAFDLNERTIAELPVMILGWIRDQIANNYDPAADAADLNQKREAVQAEARAALANCSMQERERFERVLARAVRAYPSQGDNVFFTQGAPTAIGRYALLELQPSGKQAGDRKT